MKNFLSTRIVVAFTFSASLLLCIVTSSHAAGTGARASSVRATGGLTPEEYWDQQLELHEWLMSELPDGTLDAPIRVPLTQQDRNDIANDRTPFPRPLRVGMVKRVGRTVELWRGGPISKASNRQTPGVFRRTNDGGFAWAVALESDGASALRVHLSDISLPDSADVYFFSLDGQAHGPYRGRDAFWSNSIIGSQGIVLVRQFGSPAAGAGPMSIAVSSVGNLGERFAAAQAPLCDNNHECTEDAESYNDKDEWDKYELVSDLQAATAKMQWVQGAWIYSCSGGLLADNDPDDQIWYFLTANHCLKSNAAARNLELNWNYTTSYGDCEGGPWGTPTLGATVKATGAQGDFTLLELNEPPPAGSVFMGWTSAEVATTDDDEFVLHRVHHPKGAPQSYTTHFIDHEGFGTCAGLSIPQFIYSRDTLGTTESGSSGSLVVNDDGLVVGQLYGGCGTNFDECFSDDWRTVDGAFAYYYPKIAKFLGPDLTCVSQPEICDDNSDNDCDGDIDCNDSDCADLKVCDEDICEPKNVSCTVDLDCCSTVCKPNGRCR